MTPVTILVVEDDERVRRMLRSALCSSFEVLSTGSRAEALSFLERESIAAAIVDLFLKDGVAFPLLEALSCMSPKVPVLVATGYPSVAAVVQSEQYGFQLRKKPLAIADVLSSVNGELADDPVVSPRFSVPYPTPDRVRWEYIQGVLHSHDGNVSATAKSLRMHRQSLQRYLSKSPPP
jgi:two-component system, response regulator RegA